MSNIPVVGAIVLALAVGVSSGAEKVSQNDIDISEEPKEIVMIEEAVFEEKYEKASIVIFEEPDPEPEPEPEPEMVYLGRFKITGYDACATCCGKSDEITASGVKARVNHTCATHKYIPFGTRLYIEGLGEYTVEDRGVKKGIVDIFCNNHEECYALTGYYEVWRIVE